MAGIQSECHSTFCSVLDLWWEARNSNVFYVCYRVAHEKPAHRLVDLRPRWSTRWQTSFSCATL